MIGGVGRSGFSRCSHKAQGSKAVMKGEHIVCTHRSLLFALLFAAVAALTLR